MPSYIVSLKDGSSDEELEKVKQEAIDKGGKITQEYSLIKGFAVQIPDDSVSVLKNNKHVDVEVDQEVKTQ